MGPSKPPPSSHVISAGAEAAAQASAEARPSVVTPGNHDGVHAGHRCLVAEARRIAAQHAPPLRVVALTFHPHPLQLVAPERAPALLTTPERRAELLRASGADEVVVRPFDAAFASLSPEAFLGDVLIGEYGARAVVVGDDFRFGKNRGGDVGALEAFGAARGLTVRAVPRIVEQGEPISSSRVRAALVSGDVARAAALLKRVHDLDGVVVEGHRRGRTIGVPTANLALGPVLPPADGVYAVAVRVLGDAHPLRFGTANLGVRPTVQAGRSLEVHLHDFQGDLYGKTLRIGFIARLREERKFPDLAALTAQIARDVAASRSAGAACQPELLAWM